MNRSEARILTTHVGSLPRPPEQVDQAMARLQAGVPFGVRPEDNETEAERAQLAAAVNDVVVAQLDAGLDSINDGEFGKSSWSNYILERISGFDIRGDDLRPANWLGRDRERFKGFFSTGENAFWANGAPAEHCIAPIAYINRAPVERDLANLVAAAEANKIAESEKEIFFTSVAPASTAYQGVNDFYATEEEYIFAIADALREEYKTIIDSGVILQVDDAVLANMYDYEVEQGQKVWEAWAQLRVDALNHALEGLPEDRIRYHICFGSWHAPHVADAPFAEMARFMLQVNAGAYSIEAANPRHEHEWTIWEKTKFPEDKILIPGVVTHHTITVEHPELVAQRIERFARLVGPESVIGGTDCGFAQAAMVRRVHPEVMWAKLGALAEGAEIASKRLFGKAHLSIPETKEHTKTTAR